MCYTSPTKKARIVLLKAQGFLNQNIAARFAIDPTTVGRIFKTYSQATNFYRVGHKSGHPPKLTDSDVRYAIQLLAGSKARDVADVKHKYFPHLHAQTLRDRLRKVGQNAYKGASPKTPLDSRSY